MLTAARRIVGQALDGDWLVYVYASGANGRLLGSGRAPTCPLALQRAGLSGDDAGEALGGAGI